MCLPNMCRLGLGLCTQVALCTMRHSKESQLCAMPYSTESTHICKYLCQIETKIENILG
jgi:hypothetical protein